MIYILGYWRDWQGPIGSAITFLSWSKYHHVAAMLGDGTTYQAQAFRGVTKRADCYQTHPSGCCIDVFRFPLRSNEAASFVAYLESRVGSKYDYRGVLGFLSRRDGAQSAVRDFCSELLMSASIAAGVPLQERVEAHRVAPGWVCRSPLLEYDRTLEII